MSNVTSVAQGVFRDLQRRRLLPVAGLLLFALVALPVLMLKSSEPVPVVTAASTAAPGADGLPSPEDALQGGSKPLVSLAVLDHPSDLDSFESKNPFKPLDQVSTAGASTTTASTSSSSGSSGGGSSSSSFTVTGGATGGGGGDTPTTTKPKKVRKFTYAVDATLTGPSRLVHYHSILKLTMLPTQSEPVLIFLGVDSTGQKAVFLVDSSLTVTGGEGTCTPSTDSCATVALEPGEVETFTNGQGGNYKLQIDQIREVSTAAAARASGKPEGASARTATGSPRRFVPPVITDLLTGSR